MATINTIKNNREAAIENAKKDIIAIMKEVGGNTKVCYNDNGTPAGINGGKYVQIPNGDATIAASSVNAVMNLEKEIQKGLQGDGKYHRTLTIAGIRCDCVGATLEELEEDIEAAKKYAATHKEIFGLVTAEQLVVAGYEPEDLKQVTVQGQTLFISYSEERIFDKEGKTVADLSDIYTKKDKHSIEELLLERAEEALYVEEEDEYYDEDEDWDEDERYDEDEENDEEDDDEEESDSHYFDFVIKF